MSVLMEGVTMEGRAWDACPFILRILGVGSGRDTSVQIIWKETNPCLNRIKLNLKEGNTSNQLVIYVVTTSLDQWY